MSWAHGNAQRKNAHSSSLRSCQTAGQSEARHRMHTNISLMHRLAVNRFTWEMPPKLFLLDGLPQESILSSILGPNWNWRSSTQSHGPILGQSCLNLGSKASKTAPKAAQGLPQVSKSTYSDWPYHLNKCSGSKIGPRQSCNSPLIHDSASKPSNNHSQSDMQQTSWNRILKTHS